MPIFITKAGEIDERPVHEQRSEQLEDLITQRPSFMVRSGMSLLILILLLLLLCCGFISYPDTLETSASLHALHPPEPVIVKQTGIVQTVYVKEGDRVQPGTLMAHLETTADVKKVISASEVLNAFSKEFDEGHSELPTLNLQKLGELERDAQVFQEAVIRFKESLPGGTMERKAGFLRADISKLKSLRQTVQTQGVLQQQDEALSKTTFEMNEKLWKEKVISDLEYREQKSKLLAKQLSEPQNKASLLQNDKEQISKRQQLTELQIEKLNQRLVFSEALHAFLMQIEQWKQKYLLVAGQAGTVSFHSIVQPGQQLHSGDVICYVTGSQSRYYARMMIGQTNFGKIKAGQKVLLRFAAYPFEEFGNVQAKLQSVSNIPTDSGFAAAVVLPEGLKTDIGKQLVFKEGLHASAEIILEQKSLLSRFTESITKKTVR